jgi:hypothetical protein
METILISFKLAQPIWKDLKDLKAHFHLKDREILEAFWPEGLPTVGILS